MATPRRLAALLAASAIAIAACGSNDGGNGSAGASTAPGESAAPASQAPAVSTGTVSGELTVWGMGNEGAKLDVLAKALYERPGLQMEIAGSIDPEADREGLQRTMLDKQIRTLVWTNLRKSEQTTNAAQRIGITLTPARRAASALPPIA